MLLSKISLSMAQGRFTYTSANNSSCYSDIFGRFACWFPFLNQCIHFKGNIFAKRNTFVYLSWIVWMIWLIIDDFLTCLLKTPNSIRKRYISYGFFWKWIQLHLWFDFEHQKSSIILNERRLFYFPQFTESVSHLYEYWNCRFLRSRESLFFWLRTVEN